MGLTLTDICKWLAAHTGIPHLFWLILLDAFIIFNFVAISVLVIVYGLRKVAGFIQTRIGPRYVGPRGMLQTAADALKLLVKEDVIPFNADRWVFVAAPFVVFLPAFLVWVVIPAGELPHFQVQDLNLGILYIIAITTMTVVGIVMAGWASGNKWSLLGGMRSAAQLVSYEVPMTLAIAVPVLVTGSLSLGKIVEAQQGGLLGVGNWNVFGLSFLAFVVYFICALAETNQIPFDLPEAESELVAGFNVEYSGMKFALFFLAEFHMTFVVSAIAVLLFLGGWHAPLTVKVIMAAASFAFWLLIKGMPPLISVSRLGKVPLPLPGRFPLAVMSVALFLLMPDTGWGSLFWFISKVAAFVFVFIWIRATLPRIRVDQLMEFGWKFLVPAALLDIFIVSLLMVLR